MIERKDSHAKEQRTVGDGKKQHQYHHGAAKKAKSQDGYTLDSYVVIDSDA